MFQVTFSHSDCSFKTAQVHLEAPQGGPSCHLYTLTPSWTLVPHRMALLRLVVFCALAACCVARSVPPPPLPKPPSSYLLRPRNCNDSDVLAVAGFAMQNINTDQKDGYVLSLSRVHDAREHFQASDSLGQPRDRRRRPARGWPTGAFQFGSTVLCCCQQVCYDTLAVPRTLCVTSRFQQCRRHC